MDTLLNSPLETVESNPATYAYFTNKKYCINLSNLYFLLLSVYLTASLPNMNKKIIIVYFIIYYKIINYSYNKLIWLFTWHFCKKNNQLFSFLLLIAFLLF